MQSHNYLDPTAEQLIKLKVEFAKQKSKINEANKIIQENLELRKQLAAQVALNTSLNQQLKTVNQMLVPFRAKADQAAQLQHSDSACLLIQQLTEGCRNRQIELQNQLNTLQQRNQQLEDTLSTAEQKLQQLKLIQGKENDALESEARCLELIEKTIVEPGSWAYLYLKRHADLEITQKPVSGRSKYDIAFKDD